MKTNIDHNRLTSLWKTYINDSSIFTKESFGKYVHTRIMVSGWCWPDLFYAENGKAYNLLYAHIHKKDETGIRRVS